MQDSPLGNSNIGAMRAPTIEEERERLLTPIKEFRKSVDALIQIVPHRQGEETKGVTSLKTGAYNLAYEEAYANTRIHLTDAKMWAGKLLEALGNPFPAELADKANVQ